MCVCACSTLVSPYGEEKLEGGGRGKMEDGVLVQPSGQFMLFLQLKGKGDWKYTHQYTHELVTG